MAGGTEAAASLPSAGRFMLEKARAYLRSRSRRSILSLMFLVAWLANYLRGVSRVRLHFSPEQKSPRCAEARERLLRILQGCPSLFSVYFPPWFAPGALLQFAVLSLKELRALALTRRQYRRQLLTLHDGAEIALDWVQPRGRQVDGGETLPVCVLLHGAFMDSKSVTMTDLAKHLAAQGFPAVVMNRRGYAGTPISAASPKMNMFGFDEDLDDVLQAIAHREPGRPVAVIGFSCGSGYAGRYVGKRSHLSAFEAKGNGEKSGFPPLLCGVAMDPGYDCSLDGAVSNITAPYRWVFNLGMKYQYAFRHREALRLSYKDAVTGLLSPKSGTVETFRLTWQLSGVDGDAWLDMTQPRLHEIGVPCLLLNSRDDPICVWRNVEAAFPEVLANPHIVLAELRQGSHGCKLGFMAWSNVAHAMISEFVMASWREWRASRGGAAR